MRSGARTRRETLPSFEGDRSDTERLWREVVMSFGDPRRHALFVAHCLHAGELAFAAARYAAEAASPDLAHATIARSRRRQIATVVQATGGAPARRAPAAPTPAPGRERLISATALRLVTARSGALVPSPLITAPAAPIEAWHFPPATSRIANPSSAAASAGGHSDPPPSAVPAGGPRH